MLESQMLVLAVVGFLCFILGRFLKSYSSEKGKNLATREDVASITKLVEDVKHQNSLLIEEQRTYGQLRLAAADRRLEAHQNAFTLWRKVFRHCHDDYSLLRPIIIECEQWWERNCLYLSPEASSAFDHAYWAAGSHASLLPTGPLEEIT
jgi:hypothetical protein